LNGLKNISTSRELVPSAVALRNENLFLPQLHCGSQAAVQLPPELS